MSDYCIWIVSPPGYSHSHAFDEVAESLHHAFRELGYAAPVVRDLAGIKGRPIILGANLLPSLKDLSVPDDAILFNLEQILPGSPWLTPTYLDLLRSFQVWDYSHNNIRQLNQQGILKTTYCGIGYTSELTRIQPVKQDIDVLLYGSMNPRRTRIIEELRQRKIGALPLFNMYGAERDQIIARAKIVLNVHFYESRIFEIIRVSYLLANKVFVISENGSDAELETPLKDGLVLAPYDSLVAECYKFLQDKYRRARIAERGFERMRSLRQSGFLQKALEEGAIR